MMAVRSNKRIWTGSLQANPKIGWVCVAATAEALVSISMTANPLEFHDRLEKCYIQVSEDRSLLVEQALEQISAYLQCQLKVFDLPLDWSILPPFQKKVLQITYAIPFGEVRTYAQLAQGIGSPRAFRAVGGAQARNPFPIIIPCHRVVGTDHHLHGFGAPGGLAAKAWLLELEGHALKGLRLI